MVDRVATTVVTSTLIDNNSRLQGLFADGQFQLSSGLRADSFQDVSDDSFLILNLQSDVARISAQTENAGLVLNRVEVAFGALDNIISLGQAFIGDLSAGISQLGTTTEFLDARAEQLINQVATSLNTSVAGRFLFAGAATRTTPVDLSDPGFGGALPPSVPNTSYYQGDDFIQSVEISDNLNIDYGITADNPAFEQIIRALDLVRTSPADPVALNEAFDLLTQGVDNLASLRSTLTVDASTLDEQIFENNSQLLFTENLLGDLINVDVAEVSTELAQIEAQLQASFSVTTRLLSLSIIDFL